MSDYGPDPFPVGTRVMVPYPPNDDAAQDDRADWPWLPGEILARCDRDEWHVFVDVPDLSLADPEGKPRTHAEAMVRVLDEESGRWYPACFRDASEIRLDAGNGGDR